MTAHWKMLLLRNSLTYTELKVQPLMPEMQTPRQSHCRPPHTHTDYTHTAKTNAIQRLRNNNQANKNTCSEFKV